MPVIDQAGSEISLVVANQFIQCYNEKFPLQTTAFLVNKANILKILNQEDCIGIKIYNGFDTVADQCNVVLMGLDNKTEAMENGVIIERLFRV